MTTQRLMLKSRQDSERYAGTNARIKPRLLDLFCGAGGAAMGYSRAGFDVVGIDIEPQPHYPFPFIQMDALGYVSQMVEAGCEDRYDAIHASPPCQAFTTMSNRHRGAGGLADDRLDLLTPALALLADIGLPWVVENVVGARAIMPNPFQLHGGMFGLGVQRPRLFSSNILILAPSPCRPVKNPVGVYGQRHDGRRLFDRADGSQQRAAASLEQDQEAMGMDWADWHGTKEAIPPAYTEFIGAQLLQSISLINRSTDDVLRKEEA